MDKTTANLAFLANHNPQLREALEAHGPSRAVVEPARKGGLCLRLGSGVVHSPYDPHREALKFVSGKPEAAHIHFGLGLGYALEADQALDGGLSLVFEPCLDLILAAVEHIDLAALLEAKKASLCYTLDQVKDKLRQVVRGNFGYRILSLPFHRETFPNLYESLVSAAETAWSQNRISLQTLHMNGRYLSHASVLALPHTIGLPGVENLRNVFQGKPCVIVSAGPSLDGNLAELIPYAERCVVIAMSRTVRALENVGIEPHFLVHNEPQPFFHYIDDCRNLRRTAFVLARQAEVLYFEHEHGPTFLFDNPADFVVRWLCHFHPKHCREMLDTAGSVATEAFSLALLMGCSPIVLIGQDLALKGKQYYALEEYNTAFSHSPNALRRIAGYYGGDATTVNSYLSFAQWFTEKAARVAKSPDAPLLINATEGGAKLANFEQRSLRETAWRYFREDLPVRELTATLTQPDPEQVITPERLKELQAFCLQRLDEVEAFCKSFKPYHRRFQKLLDEGGVHNLLAIQKHYNRLDGFKDQYVNLQKDLYILSGFIQAELIDQMADFRFLEPPTGKDEMETTLLQIGLDLEEFRRSMQAIELGIPRLRSAWAGDPPPFVR